MSDLKVFILGSPRSGTSITYYAMREVFGLKGRGESHVFPIFQRMIHQFYTYTQEFKKISGVLAAELDTRSFRDDLYAHLRIFYAKAYGGAGFVDKTPGAESIRGCDLISGAFPDARVILLQRNGIEVVNSYRSKFDASFENACQAWKHVVIASQQLVEQKQDRVLVIDQFDLTNAPETSAASIAHHLGRPELADKLAAFFVDRRVEQHSTHDWHFRQTLADIGWSDDEKAVFRTVCGDCMTALGYAL